MSRSVRRIRRGAFAAERRRSLTIAMSAFGLVTAFAAALSVSIVTSAPPKPGTADARAVRIEKEGSTTLDGKPRVRLEIYEDVLCDACRTFEQTFATTLANLIDSGAVAVDYYLVAALDAPENDDYSTRAANAAYCVADVSEGGFRRFHQLMFSSAIQPTADTFAYPDDAALIELARQIGAGDAANCIARGYYAEMVRGMAGAFTSGLALVVRMNGVDYRATTPGQLIQAITATA